MDVGVDATSRAWHVITTVPLDNAAQADTALQFSSANDSYVSIPDRPSLSPNGDFTIEAWIYQTDAQPSGYRIVDKTTAGIGDGLLFDTYHPSGNGHTLRLCAGVCLSANTAYSLNTWHHVAVSVRAGQATFYLDGVGDGGGTSGPAPVDTLDLRIGAPHIGCGGSCGLREYFAGMIDDVRLWSVARSAAQVKQDMAQPTSVPTDGLTGAWDFDEGAGTTVNDSSGNGATGTLVNGPVWVAATSPASSWAALAAMPYSEQLVVAGGAADAQGSATVPVPTNSRDVVVRVYLTGSDAAYVYNHVADSSHFSDVTLWDTGGTAPRQIDIDEDQVTYGPWSANNVTLWFKLQRPLGVAPATDSGYTLAWGNAQARTMREWADIYPFQDNFSSPALDPARWSSLPGAYAISDSTLSITSGVLQAAGRWGGGYRATMYGQLPSLDWFDWFGFYNATIAPNAGILSGSGSWHSYADNGSNHYWPTFSGLGTDSAYHLFGVARESSGTVHTFVDDNEIVSPSGAWADPAPLQIGLFDGSTTPMNVAWIKVRPWSGGTEPSVSVGQVAPTPTASPTPSPTTAATDTPPPSATNTAVPTDPPTDAPPPTQTPTPTGTATPIPPLPWYADCGYLSNCSFQYGSNPPQGWGSTSDLSCQGIQGNANDGRAQWNIWGGCNGQNLYQSVNFGADYRPGDKARFRITLSTGDGWGPCNGGGNGNPLAFGQWVGGQFGAGNIAVAPYGRQLTDNLSIGQPTTETIDIPLGGPSITVGVGWGSPCHSQVILPRLTLVHADGSTSGDLTPAPSYTPTDAPVPTDTATPTLSPTATETPIATSTPSPLATETPGPTMPRSCGDVRAGNPGAPDGDYVIAPNGDPFTVYCSDMAGQPKEYLTLVQTGARQNYALYAVGGAVYGSSVVTRFSKVRIDPATLIVDTGDLTFAQSTGSLSGANGLNSMTYATAADCAGGGSQTGSGNIDLRGTPFIVHDSFVHGGYQSAGSASFSANDQVVDLTGGGYCGFEQPASTTGERNGGPFLHLQYNAALGPTGAPTSGPTDTSTATGTSTTTPTATDTPTITLTPVPTDTPTTTGTATPTPTTTGTPTATGTPTDTPTVTNTPSPTDSPTTTATPTNTPLPGPPVVHAITIDANPGTSPASYMLGQSATISVTVLDSYGDPAADATVTATLSLGSVDNPVGPLTFC